MTRLFTVLCGFQVKIGPRMIHTAVRSICNKGCSEQIGGSHKDKFVIEYGVEQISDKSTIMNLDEN